MRRIWDSWDEAERNAAVRIAGLVFAVLTAFILIAIVSYLFHWRQDMSILGDAGGLEPAGNAAGRLGCRTGHWLVCSLFGLGSLALPLILAAVSARLIADKWPYSLAKTTLIALTGAFVASLLLAFAGKLVGLDYVFGGGLGGRLGAGIISWSNNLVGTVVTGLLVLILLAAWLFFSSKRFTRWFSGLGSAGGQDVDDVVAGMGKTPGPVAKPEPVKPEPASKPEPVAKPVPVSKPEPAAVPEPVTARPEPAKPEPAATEQPGAEGSFEVITDNTLDQDVTKELKPIDNRLDPPDGLPRYKFPSIDLLEAYSSSRVEVSNEELARNNNKIRATLANYKIQVVDVKAVMGPTVTLYKVYPAPGVQIAQIKRLQEDIAVSLNAKGVRVVTLSDSVGIEVANDRSSIVPLKALLNDDSFRESKYELPVAIGYTIQQKVKVFDLSDAPHLLVAGATKQGKSVGLNVIINSLLYSRHPSELRFVFIDPKMVEFSAYAQLLHHYLAVLPDAADEDEEAENAIVKKPKDAERILRSLCIEMDERYELLAKAGANNIKNYNAKYKERKLNPNNGHRFLPYLVVVVDEYADLTMTTGASPDARAASRSITNSIIRLAQKGRAAGLHVILATQRPSVDVISGVIKSNFPMRIAFRVASRIDSMTILDAPGAEKLIGRGDMLFSAGIDTERIQCGYISSDEIDSITGFIGDQKGWGKSYNTPYYLPSPADPATEGGESTGGSLDVKSLDDRFAEAARMVVTTQRGSTSDLQRKLGMGYAKAGRVMDQLEAAGIVGPQEGSKPRQVLIGDLDSLEAILQTYGK
ncbi:MAG: DNA translocase FtsK 4TM domain-containing protein [Bacteroidales bacterium]|nr:DNA translocase FtsK 4TM domain-containing protein [Candidatus Cryptobacteroides choladohippi]